MPVLPELLSMIVLPGRSARALASSTMRSAARALTDPPGLNHSALAKGSTPGATPWRMGKRAQVQQRRGADLRQDVGSNGFLFDKRDRVFIVSL
jgi:hypothetical protein